MTQSTESGGSNRAGSAGARVSQQQSGGDARVNIDKCDVGQFHGRYIGTVGAEGHAEGHGDFDGRSGLQWQIYDQLVYSGAWRDGKPRGMGWLQNFHFSHCNLSETLKEICTYAGEVDDAGPGGYGCLWSPDGKRAFETEWKDWTPQGWGIMFDHGDLWRVQLNGRIELRSLKDKSVAQIVAAKNMVVRGVWLGRVVAGGPTLPRREDRGVASEWDATVALADGQEVRRRFRGLTQVRLQRGATVTRSACR
jgi:hypothetical protein